MKLIKPILLLSLVIVGFGLILTLFGVVTNKYVISSIYLANGICLLLVLFFRKKEN